MQLEFHWREERQLEAELGRLCAAPVHITITDNSSTMLTLKRKAGGGYALRLHRMFLAAPPHVVKALGEWMTHPRRRRPGAVVDAFIRENRHQINRKRRRVELRHAPRGHVDIFAMYDELNAEYFDNRVDARITWGRMPVKRRRRSMRFGSYLPGEHVIRIHPLLDQSFVPQWFVRYIVFHEMLHAFLGVKTLSDGRQYAHTPEFRRWERAYPDFTRAEAWLNNPKNLKRLLRSHGEANSS